MFEDWRIVVKLVITAAVVVLISELGKRSSALGALIAALPITSLLALTWLWLETKDRARVQDLSMGIFWAVIPSLAFFAIFASLLRTSLSFGWSMLFATIATGLLYMLYLWLLGRFGITL